eukprot:Gb_10141 [translate_table: standard]
MKDQFHQILVQAEDISAHLRLSEVHEHLPFLHIPPSLLPEQILLTTSQTVYTAIILPVPSISADPAQSDL